MRGGGIRFSTSNVFSFYMMLCILMTFLVACTFGPKKPPKSLNMKLKQRSLKRMFLRRKGNYGAMF